MRLALFTVTLVLLFSVQSRAAYLLCMSKDLDSYWNPVFRASVSDDLETLTVIHGEKLYAAMTCDHEQFQSSEDGDRRSMNCEDLDAKAVLTRSAHGHWTVSVQKLTSRAEAEVVSLDCHEAGF